MGRILIVFLLAVFLTAFLACTGEKKAGTGTKELQQPQTTVADTGKATCPGCGMEMAKSEMIRYEKDGQTLYFCSEHCKENYLATVEKKTAVPSPVPQQ